MAQKWKPMRTEGHFGDIKENDGFRRDRIQKFEGKREETAA